MFGSKINRAAMSIQATLRKSSCAKLVLSRLASRVKRRLPSTRLAVVQQVSRLKVLELFEMYR